MADIGSLESLLMPRGGPGDTGWVPLLRLMVERRWPWTRREARWVAPGPSSPRPQAHTWPD